MSIPTTILMVPDPIQTYDSAKLCSADITITDFTIL